MCVRNENASTGFLCRILELVYFVDFKHTPSNRRERAWQLFCYFLHFIIILFLFLRFLNIFCRTYRYPPELFQNLHENSIFLAFYLNIFLLCSRFSEIKCLTNSITNLFPHADSKIINASNVKAKLMCFAFLLSPVPIFIAKTIETFLPLSEQELHLRKLVYETKHPERRLFFPIYIPYIDESDYWISLVINTIEMYPLTVLAIVGSIIASLIPVWIAHMEGNYQILNSFIEQIGKPHSDHKGNIIHYTSVEKNEYKIVENITIIDKKTLPSTSRTSRVELVKRRKQEIQILYEKHYVKQLIEFHQKLTDVQCKASIMSVM
uniref:Uncharacterized protein n=1 Tax=Cacopsylla melanoneura TaxID=428564 RepID=A0A8D8ZCM6_9HEMI